LSSGSAAPHHVPVPNVDTALPRIGLTAYREPAAWGVWNERADLLPATYADSVSLAGGVAVLLPPPAGDPQPAAESILGGLHGLVLTGGADVDPGRYGAEAHEHTGAPRADRDAWETALALSALGRGMPLLAICRGIQVLNVALGGNLVQHLPDVVGHDGHCPTVGRHARHDVVVAEGSRLAGIVGARTSVPTYHHQALDRVADGLSVVGWADDGTVEAVEGHGASWLVGVQWHPEVAEGESLFEAFLAACR
jgi:putative glutamine amidotransferase